LIRVELLRFDGVNDPFRIALRIEVLLVCDDIHTAAMGAAKHHAQQAGRWHAWRNFFPEKLGRFA